MTSYKIWSIMTAVLGFLTFFLEASSLSQTRKCFNDSFNDSFHSSFIMVVCCNLKTETSFFRKKIILSKSALLSRPLRECLNLVQFSIISFRQQQLFASSIQALYLIIITRFLENWELTCY